MLLLKSLRLSKIFTGSFTFSFIRVKYSHFNERKVTFMKHVKKQKLNRKDRFILALATIVRVLITPIFMWYRLYLWVWDGTMFNKK